MIQQKINNVLYDEIHQEKAKHCSSKPDHKNSFKKKYIFNGNLKIVLL